MQVLETGIFNKMYRTHSAVSKCEKEGGADHQTVTLADVQIVMTLLFCGIGVATLVFMLERLLAKCRKHYADNRLHRKIAITQAKPESQTDTPTITGIKTLHIS